MISWIAAMALASTPPIYPALHNGEFNKSTEGWEVDQGYPFSSSDGRARLLTPNEIAPGLMATAIQRIDAKPWRGKIIEVTAKVRLRSGAAGIRFSAVHNEPTRRLVRVISPANSVPPDGKWHVVRVHGRIGDDADYLNIGLYGAGPSDVDFDDVRLGQYTPPKRPISAHASEVLDYALEKIRQLHVNARQNGLWPEMAARARKDAAGAQTTADLAPAITALLGDLNEHHATLFTPEDQRASTAEQSASAYPRPSVTLIDSSIGHVNIPGFNLAHAADVAPARSYIRTVRAGLEALDASSLCGWIVDLRGNSGGTTHVMAAAVAGLARFDIKDWPDEYDEELSKNPIYSWLIAETPHDLRQADKAVAVLIDDQTASAGEDMALRFVGRPRVRSFGSPTAGYTSANESIDLPDDYMLIIPATYMHDRYGNQVKDRVTPNEQTDDPMGAAKQWLASQCN